MIYSGPAQHVMNKFEIFFNECRDGRKSNDLAPQIHILDGTKIIDFSSLTSSEQVLKAVKKELIKSGINEVTVIVKI